MAQHWAAKEARLQRGENPLFDETLLRQRMTRGERYYDEHYPGWESSVELERFDMRTPTMCLHSQVEHIFDSHRRREGERVWYVGIEDLLQKHFGPDRERHEWGWGHGFTAGFYPTHFERLEEFDHLTRLWREVIVVRRAISARGERLRIRRQKSSQRMLIER